jgi:2-oxoglutarate ferredoxin oxidoreductase subunit gamma
MECSIIIAGSGGQGILYLGKAIATAGMTEGREVTWIPSYGVEMRGGTANCTVIFSGEMIGSPLAFTPDMLIVMNTASAVKFQPRLKKGGLFFYDSSLIQTFDFRDDVVTVGIPATKIAGAFGSTRTANMVMLGAFVAKSGILKKASFSRLSFFSNEPDDHPGELNKISLLEGIRYIENQKSRNRGH